MKRIAILFYFLIIGLVVFASTVNTKDTTILENDTLRLMFYSSTFDCGASLLIGPSHYTYVSSEVIYPTNGHGYNLVYTFAPKNNFVGSDTIYFQNGCRGISGFYISDTLRYIINSKATSIVDAKIRIRLFPNPSNGDIHIIGLSNDTPMDYKIYDISGKVCQKGILLGDKFTANMRDGVYFLKICQNNAIVFEEKINIKNNCP